MRRGTKILSIAAAMVAAVGLAGAVVAQQQSITVVSFGGAYQEAQSRTMFQPAARALGITVREETYTGIADLRLRARAGSVTWDVVASGSGSAARAASEGILERLDYTIIDVRDYPPHLYTEHCLGTDVFSTVLAWNTKTYGTNGPQNWADFWDVRKFPGKRSFRRGVAGSLEPALMADGVPPERVYEVLRSPGGIERAIRKVEQLKPHVAVWWTSGAQHAQLMKDGEVDMITGWNGRFDVIAKDGAQVAYTFNQALLDYDCLAIPRGAPNRTQAMRFLAEMAKAQYQAEFTKFITYGPTNRRGYDFIEPALARLLPSYPANAALQLPIDLAWYIQFEAQAASAYENMITR